jgi:glycosyltransferase involved in cell wall biosynthesis
VTDIVQPLVSMIIPVYNHECYIKKCLDSIVNNEYGNYEILIIDDGSQDKSAIIIDQWIKENPNVNVYFRSRENKGVTKTLNELVAISKGDFICPLASDDYLLPKGIKKRVDYLLENRTIAAVFGDCIVINENDNCILDSGMKLYNGNIDYLKNKRYFPYELTFHWCAPGPVFMAKREAYDLVGLYDEDLMAEDLDFYLRLLSKNLLGFLDSKVAAYRLHQTNSVKIHAKSPEILHVLFIKTLSKNINNFRGLIYYRLKGLIFLHKYYLSKFRKSSWIEIVFYWLLGQGFCKICGLLYLLLRLKDKLMSLKFSNLSIIKG